MSWMKTLASHYQQNLNLVVVRRSFYPHELKAPPIITGTTAAFHHANNPKMQITKSTTVTRTPPVPSPPPPPSPPSQFPYITWAKWTLGFLLSIVLPFLEKKWSGLLKLESEVEMAAETIENVAEVVEKVATMTEEKATEVAEQLPEGGKLKGAALWVEHVSEEVAQEAHLTEDIIHKVDELKEDVEMLIDPFKKREKHMDRKE